MPVDTMREITVQPRSWNFFNPWSAISGVWKGRDLLKQLVRRNIEIRYKGTIMGLVWMVVTPLVMLAVYTFVFGVVFKARWGADFGNSKAAFALIMFCGMTVFNIFAESVNGSVGIVTGNPNYVKKVVFPLELLPVSSVLSACFFGLIWIGILLLGIALFFHKFCLATVCLPLIFIPLVLFSCGIAWLVASLGVFLRDLSHVIGILLQVLYFMTPIFYSVEMVPEKLRPILLLNPLTVIVQSARHVLMFDQWPNWWSLGIVTLLSMAVFQLGYFWFMKTKRGFADVL
ncbi:MAG: ABC transporter permease [Candidatus Omnitrophica bacterium]|nr:ABC transporter permease [Candidatus Omnitrophota bacterium]